jgi:hypothetical protein
MLCGRNIRCPTASADEATGREEIDELLADALKDDKRRDMRQRDHAQNTEMP